MAYSTPVFVSGDQTSMVFTCGEDISSLPEVNEIVLQAKIVQVDWSAPIVLEGIEFSLLFP